MLSTVWVKKKKKSHIFKSIHHNSSQIHKAGLFRFSDSESFGAVDDLTSALFTELYY